jgi:hypothetical protein
LSRQLSSFEDDDVGVVDEAVDHGDKVSSPKTSPQRLKGLVVDAHLKFVIASSEERNDQEERLLLIGFNGCDWLPIWLPGTDPVSRAGLRTIILPDERVRPTRPPDMSDCLRTVRYDGDDNFEYTSLPAIIAPRPRLERGTYCLGGKPRTTA